MNDEMMKTYEENENTAISAEVHDEPIEETGNGILGKVIIGLGIAVAATAAVLYKTKDKREAKQIKKLEKKGYVITKQADIVEAEVLNDDDPETEG